MFNTPIPHPIFLTTTRVELYRDALATGFFVNYSGGTYLVTNSHALVKDYSLSGDLELYKRIMERPPTIQYWIRDSDNIVNTNRNSLDLSSDSISWAFNPNGADVAAIKLSEKLPSIDEKYEDRSLKSSLAVPEEYFIGQRNVVNQSAFVVGYPDGIYDTENNLPVRRHAIIASEFDVPFEGEPKFLTDARMHAGTSGSPVFAPAGDVVETSGAHPRNPHGIPYLIGIHSGNYPVQETENDVERERQWSDLNETWYSSCAIETIRWLEGYNADSDEEGVDI